MTTVYDRLERDTVAERKRFMEIPIVKMLLNSEDAEGGTPSPEEQGYLKSVYERFLVESYYHVRAGSKVYALAGSRISEGDESIREWLLQHAIDEYGHHHWVIDDLRTLHFDVSKVPTSRPSVPTDALIAWMYYVAGVDNPVAILADSYVIEGLSQLFAAQLANSMKCLLNVPDNALTYLVRHGIADQAHMGDLRELINANVKRERDYEDMLQCAKVEFALYGQILEFSAAA